MSPTWQASQQEARGSLLLGAPFPGFSPPMPTQLATSCLTGRNGQKQNEVRAKNSILSN